MAALAGGAQTFTLEGESELRVEVALDEVCVIKVKEGFAEILGLELAPGKDYAFAGRSVAVLSLIHI